MQFPSGAFVCVNWACDKIRAIAAGDIGASRDVDTMAPAAASKRRARSSRRRRAIAAGRRRSSSRQLLLLAKFASRIKRYQLVA
jgi:hypothetical protein